jgi:hypothetical protein
LKRVPKAIYRTAKDIEALIERREADAAALQPGAARQSVLIEIAQLRAYADVKRWVQTPPVKGRAANARPKEQA